MLVVPCHVICLHRAHAPRRRSERGVQSGNRHTEGGEDKPHIGMGTVTLRSLFLWLIYGRR
jgi:hypothetical protein